MHNININVHDKRPAWWVLRYIKSKEAFAISDFHEVLVATYLGNLSDVAWKPPRELRFLIEDRRTDLLIMDYAYENITQAEYETYLAFGIPHVDLLYIQDALRKTDIPILAIE